METDDGWNLDVVQDEKESILAGAYEYIENLQRQVQELNDELDGESAYSDDDDEDDVSSCEDDLGAEAGRPVDSNAGLELDRAECCGCSNPTVRPLLLSCAGCRNACHCQPFWEAALRMQRLSL
jgi:(p)ppGpp synthase/HD superfamily hydrolase